MLEWWQQLLWAWGGLASAMLVLWAIQCRTRDASSVDAAWALGIGAAAMFFAGTGTSDDGRSWLAAGLVAVWALRLGSHLLIDRVLQATAEDGRYAAMRTHWGPRANAHFLWFYQAQALAALLFASPFLLLANDPRPLQPFDGIWIGWWVITLALVWVADRQLARWRADPLNRGRTCRAGLWSRSRHPNYFFEWLHWFAYVGLAWGGAYGPWTLAIPFILYVLLNYVTGIPYVELRALKTRGDDYREYQRQVPAFVPRFWSRR